MEDIFSGYKSYIVGTSMIVVGIVLIKMGYGIEGMNLIAAGMGLMSLKSAIKKAE